MNGGRVAYETKDPAPAADAVDAGALAGRLQAYERPLFDRFQAVFALRNLGGPEAVQALGDALRNDPSPLLRHEVAYVFGQMGDASCMPHLEAAIVRDPHPMVRHEAVEAVGNFPDVDSEALLVRVRQEDPDPEVRASADLALANLAYLRDGLAF